MKRACDFELLIYCWYDPRVEPVELLWRLLFGWCLKTECTEVNCYITWWKCKNPIFDLISCMEWLQPLAHAVYWSFPSLTEWRISSEGLNCCKKRWCSYNYFFVIIMTVLQYYCHCRSWWGTCNTIRVGKLSISLKLSLPTPLSWDILWPDIYMLTNICWLIYCDWYMYPALENNVCWLVH